MIPAPSNSFKDPIFVGKASARRRTERTEVGKIGSREVGEERKTWVEAQKLGSFLIYIFDGDLVTTEEEARNE